MFEKKEDGLDFWRGFFNMLFYIYLPVGVVIWAAHRWGVLSWMMFAIAVIAIIVLGHGAAKGIILWRLNNRNKDQDK
jgi:hypothetical protein